MWTTPNVSNGALVGASIGVVIALALLVLGQRGGEAYALSWFLVGVFGVPVTLVAIGLSSLGAFSFGLAVVAVPLNGALLGALVGGTAQALGIHTRATFAAIPVLWFGILAITAWLARTH